MDLCVKKPGKGKEKTREPKEKGTRSNSLMTSAKGTADMPNDVQEEEEADNLDDTPKQKNSAGDKFGRVTWTSR
jgi:hypothetical protein